jgi:hypothetical protein
VRRDAEQIGDDRTYASASSLTGNLFVQEIANRNSPARKALRLFFNGDISLFVSEPIIAKFESRAELRRKLPGIHDGIVDAVLTKLEAKAILLANIPREFPLRTRPR